MGAVCQWKEWTDSEWVTVGDTSRFVLGAFLSDIGDLVAFAIQHCHSTYHLSNFAMLSTALNNFIVQASVVSFVSGTVSGMLFIR